MGTLEWVSGKVKEIRALLLKSFFALNVWREVKEVPHERGSRVLKSER